VFLDEEDIENLTKVRVGIKWDGDGWVSEGDEYSFSFIALG
jgi:hypothetical protein